MITSTESHQLATPRKSAPDLRMVIMVGPGPGRQGGISRMAEYIAAAWPIDGPELVIIDPAPSGGPALGSLVRALARVAKLSIGRRPGVVIHLNMASSGSTVRKVLFSWLSRILGVPYIVHLHSGHFPRFMSNLPGLARSLIRGAFRSASHVIVLGRVWEAFAVEALGTEPNRIVLLPNAVPGPPSSSGADAAVTRLVYLGRLCDDKGTPELLYALADPRLQDLPWEAVLAGDGEHERFRHMAEELGIAERMTFLEWLSPAEVEALLKSAAILALPSHAEGCPMVVLEAIAHGVPVVATRVGGIPDVIRDGLEGRLVLPRDVSGLADALEEILRNADYRLTLGMAARQRWTESFDIQQYTKALILLHQSVVPQHPHSGPQSPRRAGHLISRRAIEA